MPTKEIQWTEEWGKYKGGEKEKKKRGNEFRFAFNRIINGLQAIPLYSLKAVSSREKWCNVL